MQMIMRALVMTSLSCYGALEIVCVLLLLLLLLALSDISDFIVKLYSLNAWLYSMKMAGPHIFVSNFWGWGLGMGLAPSPVNSIYFN